MTNRVATGTVTDGLSRISRLAESVMEGDEWLRSTEREALRQGRDAGQSNREIPRC